MTTNDLDLAREVADTITQSPKAYDSGMQATARVIASLPDEWIDADNLREALDWRDSKPSGDDYDGEFYDRLRNLLPPALPDPLFGARATHPEYGEGTVISHHPDKDGEVRFTVRGDDSDDGTWSRWVKPQTLTFHTPDMSKNAAEIDTSTAHVDPIDTTPDHPVFLETEEDYANAPEGTIVAQDEGKPFVLIDELWRNPNPWRGDHGDMAGIRRRVLRWGWEA